MLIHVAPRLFHAGYDFQAGLIDFHIEQFGLHLRGDKDLVARRPYPNKCFLVACRKVGQKAIDGILIDTAERAKSFNCVTRWAINADLILTHRVNYVLIDDEFDAASDDMVLWHATSKGLGGWESRWPEVEKGTTPANARPRMDVLSEKMTGAKRVGDVRDTLDPNGFIVERSETCRLPTLERERLLSLKLNDRIPSLDAAFRVSRKDVAQTA